MFRVSPRNTQAQRGSFRVAALQLVRQSLRKDNTKNATNRRMRRNVVLLVLVCIGFLTTIPEIDGVRFLLLNIHHEPPTTLPVDLLPVPTNVAMRPFLQTNDPIIKTVTPSGEPPVTRVRIVSFDHKARRGAFLDEEIVNICMDGFQLSPYFEVVGKILVPDFTVNTTFVLEEDEDIVWAVDMRRTMTGQPYTIHRQLVDLANNTIHDQQEKLRSKKIKRQPRIDIVLMEFRDIFPGLSLCSEDILTLRDLLGDNGSVRNVVQPVVKDRRWNAALNFTSPGYIYDPTRDNECFGATTLHVPYTVRSDYADAVMQTFPRYLPPASRSTNAADTVRPTDIAHYWAHNRNDISGYIYTKRANLRNAVTDVIAEMAEEKESLKVVVNFVSVAAGEGRVQASPEYTKALLTTKIVVVAQRDAWEDHFRLTEALIGGGLVMSDPMLSLLDGLVDKENIVVYHSLAQLRELLEYYLDPRNEAERLAIARAGWDLARTRHRTYHWMERVFFGRVFTK